MVTAPPGFKVSLPVFAHSATAQRQRYAGEPCATSGIQHPGKGNLGRRSSGASVEAQTPSHRTLLFFRLPEQAVPSGPVQLDRWAAGQLGVVCYLKLPGGERPMHCMFRLWGR
jgi:hypothetical protein